MGGGVAFSTPYKSHLLNVPASGMSAFTDDPEHFARWLDRQGHPGGRDDFVPRQFYRHYLRDTLRAQAGSSAGRHVLEVRDDVVVDVEPIATGARVRAARSEPVDADAVVLAVGIIPPRFPDGVVRPGAEARCLANPWDPTALAGVEPSATVTLLGTGLSALDVLLALQENGHHGPVHAVSRHGLLPHVHAARTRPASGIAEWCQELNGTRARTLLRQVREIVAEAEAQGGDWRDVVDLLRPRAQGLWMALAPPEQLRFKRHLERYWSVHRHRMAPEVGAEVERLSDAGLFHVHSGQILAVDAAGSSLRLAVKSPATGARPPLEHRLASQLLGYRLRCFSRRPGPDEPAPLEGLGPSRSFWDRRGHRFRRKSRRGLGSTRRLALGRRFPPAGSAVRKHGGTGDKSAGPKYRYSRPEKSAPAGPRCGF